MAVQIIVVAYSGFKANERPQAFLVDDGWHDVASIEDRWLEPGFEYFKVRTADAKTYLLRYEGQGDVWTLQSEFDGHELFSRPGSKL